MLKKDLTFLMVLFQLVIIFLLINCNSDKQEIKELTKTENVEWKCEKMDQALLKIKLNIPTNDEITTVKYQYEICNQCDLIDLFTFDSTDFNVTLDSYYSYKYQVESKSLLNNKTTLVCDEFKFNKYEECGIYLMEINGTNKCSIYVLDKSQILHSDYYLILAAGIVILLSIVSNLVMMDSRLKKWILEKLSCNNQVKVELKDFQKNPPLNEAGSENRQEPPEKVIKKQRLQSLDTFRGISLFLMIFVNYGSGGFKYLAHVPWHGLTLADFVFPWFLWIMGFSIPLSTNSMLSKPNPNRLEILKKILIRFIKMFAIGIMLNTRYGVKLSELRIFGVLQRIALCYLIVATVELVFYRPIKIENLKGIKYYMADLIW